MQIIYWGHLNILSVNTLSAHLLATENLFWYCFVSFLFIFICEDIYVYAGACILHIAFCLCLKTRLEGFVSRLSLTILYHFDWYFEAFLFLFARALCWHRRELASWLHWNVCRRNFWSGNISDKIFARLLSDLCFSGSHGKLYGHRFWFVGSGRERCGINRYGLHGHNICKSEASLCAASVAYLRLELLFMFLWIFYCLCKPYSWQNFVRFLLSCLPSRAKQHTLAFSISSLIFACVSNNISWGFAI